MRFIALMSFVAISAFAGIMVVDRAVSGNSVASKLRSFHDWTIQSHWVNPANRQVTVLLDEEAVTGTDSKCEAVLSMLNRLTKIVPQYKVFMISPTGWVPSRWNPIDRQGVEWMIKDLESNPANEPSDERPDEWKDGPPAAYKAVHRTENSH